MASTPRQAARETSKYSARDIEVLEGLEPVRRRIAAGDLKMTVFWPDVRVREVGSDELAPFGDPAELFLNVNAPEDYERARALPLRQ